MTRHEDTEVVVVGAGPVGLLLACELRLAGTRVVLLERQTAFDTRLRAPGITERTVEALDRRGLLDPLVDAVAEVVEPAMMTRRGPDGSAPAMLPIRPEVLERVLFQRATGLGVVVRRGLDVHGVRQDGTGAEVMATDVDGRSHVYRGQYVVGCDGGRSAVRKSAGIVFHGGDTGLVGYQAVAEVEDAERLGREWRRTDGGVVAYALGPSRVVTIEFDAAVAHNGPVTVAEVEASLRRTSGVDVRLVEPRSLTRFTDNCRLAGTYRRGRVLLAGDAAHVHPPFGGQGLNLGMQDAVNLGWKLAAMVTGRAPADLLDTYEAERRPVAERAIRNSRAAVSILRPGAENTPLFELFFGELMKLDEVRTRMHELFSMTDLRYPTCGDHPMAGTAAPDLLLRTDEGEIRLSRLCADGHGVLLDLADDAELRDSAAKWSDRVDVVTCRTDAFPGVDAVLLRPDGYVAEAWPTGEAGARCPASLARWFGAA